MIAFITQLQFVQSLKCVMYKYDPYFPFPYFPFSKNRDTSLSGISARLFQRNLMYKYDPYFPKDPYNLRPL